MPVAVPAGCEPRLVSKDRGLQLLELLARLDPELVERRARLGVRVQRLRLPPGPVEGEHEQLARAFAKRVLADQRLELGDDVGRVPELDVRRDPLLDGDESQLVEPADLALRPVLEGELGQRRAAPEREGLHEQRASFLRCRTPRVAQEPLEAMHVDLVTRHGEQVPRWAEQEDVRPERLPQRDDAVLHRRRRVLRRLGAVELVDELLGRHHPARAQEQRDEQRALASAPRERSPPARPSPRAGRGSERKASVRRL